jgi:hypothetical protein
MHLTRQKARTLPTFLDKPHFDPVHGIVLDKSFSIPIQMNGHIVSSMGPGWSLDGLSLLFYPTIIVQFRRPDGETSCWYLNASFAFVCSNVGELPAKTKTRIGQKVGLIAAFLSGASEGAIPCRVPDNVKSFLELSEQTQRGILGFFGHAPAMISADFLGKDPSSGTFVKSITVVEGRHYAGSELHELRMGSSPISLLPGWQIASISSIFFPLLVADLRHSEGDIAYWFFDSLGNHLCNTWKSLSEVNRTVLATYGVAILEDLWDDLVASPGDRTFDHVLGFLELSAGVRHAVFDLYCTLPRPTPQTAVWTMTDAAPDIMAYVAQTERGAALLSQGHIEKALARAIQDQNVILANDGQISWPSPISGNELFSSGFALMIDDLCFAYLVQDVEIGLTFYVLAALGHFRTFAIYFPENDLLVARDPAVLLEMQRYKNIRPHLLNHVLYYGADILAGRNKPTGELFHAFRGRAAIHIGHFIWQDLSGISDFLARVRQDRIPNFLVIENTYKPEIYGPIDTIFPALQNKVRRLDQTFAEITPHIYRENQRIFKATSMHVPSNIGKSILSGYKGSSLYSDVVDRCREVREKSDILVLIGLRMGNRTISEIEAFSLTLINAICDAFPNASIVIDGQNASPDVVYDSFGDNPASSDNFLNQELRIAKVLVDHASKRGHRVINNIGRPIVESLLWCDAADFFVSPWGAALAKYRWVCNKPGLVITGKWNLSNRRDLAIYHGTQFNQDPSEMWLNDPSTVEDDVEPGETSWTKVERSNFKVDANAIIRQLLPLLQERARMHDHQAVQ